MNKFYKVEEYDPRIKEWHTPEHLWYACECDDIDEAKCFIESQKNDNKRDQAYGYKYRILECTTKIVK